MVGSQTPLGNAPTAVREALGDQLSGAIEIGGQRVEYTVTTNSPRVELDVVRCRSGTPFTAVSIGRVTRSPPARRRRPRHFRLDAHLRRREFQENPS